MTRERDFNLDFDALPKIDLAIEPVTLGGHRYEDCSIYVFRYQFGGGTYVGLNCINPDTDWQEPLATLTVNVEGDERVGSVVWAKNYSENEGLVDALVAQKLVERTGRTCPQGFIELEEIVLLGPILALLEHFPAPAQTHSPVSVIGGVS